MSLLSARRLMAAHIALVTVANAAKAAGKRQWRRYRPLLRSRMVERHDLQSQSARAVADKAFALRYQPLVDITGGEVVGLEARVRRRHEQRPAAAPGRSCGTRVGHAPQLVAAAGQSAAVPRHRGAARRVDDAHGFGVIGERGPGETCPYGMHGNCVVRHTGESYDGIVLVAGFSKAYSSLLAFLALPSELKNRLKTAAAPYLYSGPSPTASPATALAGLDVNERRGDVIRADLYRKTVRVLDRLEGLGVDTLNTDRLPIVDVPLANPADLDAVAAYLWEEGIYVTLAACPLVPRDRVGFRIQLTALSSDDDIDRLNGTLTRLSERFPLRLKG
ncbi:aminotransferase class I/II-fold pyridoxal phosphate-dependent enzyme [Streptomyces coeruleorubidus]|uniref:aminotransferase class I/II-fold pyridoxal phosphate-dependent enzyme n=1 Tax=Streptomyces coeruleorubidus TaxID=116188 RepID=UPI00379A8B9D